jgi:hypothetical protein
MSVVLPVLKTEIMEFFCGAQSLGPHDRLAHVPAASGEAALNGLTLDALFPGATARSRRSAF